MLNYCRHCVMTDARPDLQLEDQDICNACRRLEKCTEVEWDARYQQIVDALAHAWASVGVSMPHFTEQTTSAVKAELAASGELVRQSCEAERGH